MFQRVIGCIGILFGISLISFMLSNLAPGDPAAILLELQQPGVPVTPEAVEAYRVQLGLDHPVPVRYMQWLSQVIQGDLGRSYRTGQPVAAEIMNRLPATIQLTITSLMLAVFIGVPLGMVSALRRDSWLDWFGRLVALAGSVLPSYLLSILLVLLFSVWLGWLPAFGSGSWQHLILPSLALAFGAIAQISRLTRASLLDVLAQDYIRTAWAKGLRTSRVVISHALRNALVSVVTVIGVSVGNLLSGAVIVETVFSWFGIGKYAVDAIFLRDYPAIQGVVLYMAVAFVLVNLVVDLIIFWLDPRMQRASSDTGRLLA